MVDRIEQTEQLARTITVAEGGEGNDTPNGGMGVLAAVLAHTGQIPLVSRIDLPIVKWWGEEQHQTVTPMDQVFLHRVIAAGSVGGRRRG